ncbi:WhiB family transcriptional regulator [Mycolicibacterium helvum]|uniref:Transcriptional regulator WhiB n=1 Tax=Mycolicibacterium helvum TaxID=1534349 RepID=A0A7I7T9Q3_9MYCO|nr:WhiB family transcriptional regulator [Mycolicibacterium helvum]BBY65513.1 redox-responsive transcriptional regulator WhiB3 [Mycolicibacterium helvum]
MTGHDRWEWRLRARCRAEDPSLFFHPEGERGVARTRREQLAKQVCAQCPVIDSCRHHSLAYVEAFGTWGGLSETERSRLLPPHVSNLRTHRSYAGRASH